MSTLPDPLDALDRLREAKADLVLALRLAAEDLAQAEPTDSLELAGKIYGLRELVEAGITDVILASEAYDEVPEEPIR